MNRFRKTSLALLITCLVGVSSFTQSNGESELTTVMKTLLQYMKQERELILNGQKQQRLPMAALKQVNTAAITPGKKKHDDHARFAEELTKILKRYHKTSDLQERKARYNVVVTHCIGCHEMECPGPIFTIKGLRIK